MSVTAAVFQLVPLVGIARLKERAPRNICLILVTAAVFQEEIFPLKAIASINISLVEVTAAVFQEEISPLKTVAPLNIPTILVTAVVFQMSPLVLIG